MVESGIVYNLAVDFEQEYEIFDRKRFDVPNSTSHRRLHQNIGKVNQLGRTNES